MSEVDAPFDPQPSYVLHPIRGMLWATFWGSPIAAGIVMAINYWKVGNSSAAWKVMLTGILFTLSFFAVLYTLPMSVLDSTPQFLFVAVQLVLVYFFANAFQSDLLARHEARGGDVASAWPSVGIGVLCLPLAVAGVFGMAFLYELAEPAPLLFGNDEIYLSGEATEEDANKLADLLREVDYFGSAGGISVGLEKSAGQYTIQFVLWEGTWNDPETITEYLDLGAYLTESGFPAPLTIELCNDFFEVQETVLIQ